MTNPPGRVYGHHRRPDDYVGRRRHPDTEPASRTAVPALVTALLILLLILIDVGVVLYARGALAGLPGIVRDLLAVAVGFTGGS